MELANVVPSKTPLPTLALPSMKILLALLWPMMDHGLPVTLSTNGKPTAVPSLSVVTSLWEITISLSSLLAPLLALIGILLLSLIVSKKMVMAITCTTAGSLIPLRSLMIPDMEVPIKSGSCGNKMPTATASLLTLDSKLSL